MKNEVKLEVTKLNDDAYMITTKESYGRVVLEHCFGRHKKEFIKYIGTEIGSNIVKLNDGSVTMIVIQYEVNSK